MNNMIGFLDLIMMYLKINYDFFILEIKEVFSSEEFVFNIVVIINNLLFYNIKISVIIIF